MKSLTNAQKFNHIRENKTYMLDITIMNIIFFKTRKIKLKNIHISRNQPNKSLKLFINQRNNQIIKETNISSIPQINLIEVATIALDPYPRESKKNDAS